MYEKKTLPNGVRILTEHVPGVLSVSLGIWVGTGSRHESAGENGAAHFIEHMLFKGTRSRTAAQLAEEMDAVGGQINAFTTKGAPASMPGCWTPTWPGRRTSCATCSSTPGSTTPTWRPSGG